jgi:FlaA1/EpsC-like NDP-sugar epimerase
MRSTIAPQYASLPDRLVLFGQRNLRVRHLVAFDLVAICLAVYGALVIRYEELLTPGELLAFLPMIAAPLVIRPLVNTRMGLYRRVWGFASVGELVAVVAAGAVGSILSIVLALGVLWPLSGAETFIGPSFWALEFVLSVGLVGGVRFLIRALSEWRRRRTADFANEHRVPTLLYGAGHAGAAIARSAMNEPKAGVRPVGFLDDDPSRSGKWVAGLPVYGDVSQLQQSIVSTDARMLLITMPTAPGDVIRSIVEAGLAAGLEVRTVPPVHELLDGSIDAYRARRVKVDDLLGRPLATEHAPAVEGLIRHKTIVITGAGGSIGSELARQVHSLHPARLVLIDRAESPLYTIQRELEVRALRGRGSGSVEVHLANVVSRSLMKRLIADTAPHVILHAAAYKHVPMMEEHPSEGVQVNVGGTMSMLDAAEAAGVPHFVFVSTDKAVEPSSVMGATKRIAEALVADAARRTGRAYASVRFGNVLGSAGSVVPIFLGQIERGEAITVTDPEMTRYFMTIPEASWLILDAAALARSGDLFVLDMGAPVRILDLAQDLIRLSGRSAESVRIEFTGLRPGEKLHEQLFYGHEEVEETGIQKVLRTAAEPPPGDVRQRALHLLSSALGDRDEILREEAFDVVEHIVTGHATVEEEAPAAIGEVTFQGMPVRAASSQREGADVIATH